jgi:hypothetical protein
MQAFIFKNNLIRTPDVTQMRFSGWKAFQKANLHDPELARKLFLSSSDTFEMVALLEAVIFSSEAINYKNLTTKT